MKNKVKEFAESVGGTIYDGSDFDWEFYFTVSGFLNGKYFHVIIIQKHSKQWTEIIKTTDCAEEIKEVLTRFEIKI
jgi:hypothetical protein